MRETGIGHEVTAEGRGSVVAARSSRGATSFDHEEERSEASDVPEMARLSGLALSFVAMALPPTWDSVRAGGPPPGKPRSVDTKRTAPQCTPEPHTPREEG